MCPCLDGGLECPFPDEELFVGEPKNEREAHAIALAVRDNEDQRGGRRAENLASWEHLQIKRTRWST